MIENATYEGHRTSRTCHVTKDGRALHLYRNVRDHSPTGPEWGYGGAGPAQLALALCCDALGVRTTVVVPDHGNSLPPALVRALRVYQEIKVQLLVPLGPAGYWSLTTAQVLDAIGQVERQQRARQAQVGAP